MKKKRAPEPDPLGDLFREQDEAAEAILKVIEEQDAPGRMLEELAAEGDEAIRAILKAIDGEGEPPAHVKERPRGC